MAGPLTRAPRPAREPARARPDVRWPGRDPRRAPEDRAIPEPPPPTQGERSPPFLRALSLPRPSPTAAAAPRATFPPSRRPPSSLAPPPSGPPSSLAPSVRLPPD